MVLSYEPIDEQPWYTGRAAKAAGLVALAFGAYSAVSASSSSSRAQEGLSVSVPGAAELAAQTTGVPKVRVACDAL